MQQLGAFRNLVADGEVEGRDAACGGSVDGAFHLHGFEDQKRCALFNGVAGRDNLGDDAAGHGSEEAAVFGGIVEGDVEGIMPGEDEWPAVEEDMKFCLFANDGGVETLTVDDGSDAAVVYRFATGDIGLVVEDDAVSAVRTILDADM